MMLSLMSNFKVIPHQNYQFLSGHQFELSSIKPSRAAKAKAFQETNDDKARNSGEKGGKNIFEQ